MLPKVLVVEGDPNVGRLLHTVLRRACVVEVANDAAGALAAIAAASFDVVVCDIHLPDAPASRVYADAVTLVPSLADRFVFTTRGSLTDEDATFLVDKPLLQKPFPPSRLRAAIESRLAPHMDAVGA